MSNRYNWLLLNNIFFNLLLPYFYSAWTNPILNIHPYCRDPSTYKLVFAFSYFYPFWQNVIKFWCKTWWQGCKHMILVSSLLAYNMCRAPYSELLYWPNIWLSQKIQTNCQTKSKKYEGLRLNTLLNCFSTFTVPCLSIQSTLLIPGEILQDWYPSIYKLVFAFSIYFTHIEWWLTEVGYSCIK